MALGVLLAATARAEELSPRDYAERLALVRDAAERGDLDSAREGAKALLRARVRVGRDEVAPDRTVLGPLSRERTREGARKGAERVARLVEALEADLGPSRPEPPAPDRGLLERIGTRQALERPREGGDVSGLPSADNRFTAWLEERLERIGEWVWEKAGRRIVEFLGRVLDGILRLLFGAARSGGGVNVTRLVAVIVVGAACVVAALLAWYLIRNRAGWRAPAAAAGPGPVASARDEDALSRTATEWERYAAELGAAGRSREAIRAWYHALLVTLFREGLLHYRKGRTNWEYAFALQPGVVWRGRFGDIVRSFEREWYGRTSSPADVERAFAGEAKGLLQDVRGGAR